VPTCGSASPGGEPDALDEVEQGSIIVVVGTNAPLTPDQLERIARRVSLGDGPSRLHPRKRLRRCLHRVLEANRGADAGNSEPDGSAPKARPLERLPSEAMDPLFTATVEATEEATLNAMLVADTMTGADYLRYYAIPHAELQRVLRKHGRLVETQ
jgi:L-aminopeptidase/D-esterase-like protein